MLESGAALAKIVLRGPPAAAIGHRHHDLHRPTLTAACTNSGTCSFCADPDYNRWLPASYIGDWHYTTYVLGSLPLPFPLLPSSPSSPLSPPSVSLAPTSSSPTAPSTFLAGTTTPCLLPWIPKARRSTVVPAAVPNNQQPDYPDAVALYPASPIAPIAAHRGTPSNFVKQPASHDAPFRNLAAHRLPRRLPAPRARLWNPANSTPRPKSSRKRRPSTPPPPSIPIQHSFPDKHDSEARPTESRAGKAPLLSPPEQWQANHPPVYRHSLQLDPRNSLDNRASLPRSVRASFDDKHSKSPRPDSPSLEGQLYERHTNLDKGKGKAVMAPETEKTRRSFSRDLERGLEVPEPRTSNVSVGDGIGSALSSNSSIMGEEVPPDAGDEWGPQHPCYPHLNPHVPVDSAEYVTTRVIRIRRDWLLKGDLAPTFSNLYPEILDPAGLSEQEFRRIIEKINGELVPIFNPYSARNILDGVLGLVTGWLWDDMGLTSIKSRLQNLEKWIEEWNLNMEKTTPDEGVTAPKLISLRRTGYMTLDIQIPDPEIAPAPSTHNANDSHSVLPTEPTPAVVA
ncbi:hypothetical protein S40285_01185 [Stachybotrys chlorohalonatus IBT 40285]|uniref:Ras modification protein ERF4 n=1 Tax=Stachybotrys chlorohalonatus (strain IBT 40285) TaxID=1283841 RepID=A0A084QY00_STAC4|nr:hypothetical protein S40285_01185 [Stachybotrys chlorohalonata IBT 40285]